MLYPSAVDWAEWGILDECHQFFCLHWTELFDPQTPDTWQVRSCNIKTILRELVEAARIAVGFDPYRGVMRAILDEAFAVVRRDAILENCYPFVASYLAPWAKGDIGKEAVPEVERLAIVILGNFDRYWESGVKLVKDMLWAADKGRKKELYAATMNLAIETAAGGRSHDHILGTFRATVLAKSDRPFLDRVGDVFTAFSTKDSNYKCVFLTEGIKRKYTKWLPPDIKLALGKPATVTPGPEELFYRPAMKYSVSLSVEVTAPDPRAARQAAEKRLGEVFAGLNLFNIDDRFGISVARCLVEDETGVKTIVGHRRLGSHYLGTYESRLIKVDLLFRVQERLRQSSPADASQLAAAIEYHRLALQATSEEARLVNLWIAMEALCQGGGDSIIERVWSRIAPCVSVDNVRKTLVSLSIYVKGLWSEENRGQFLALFPNSTDTRLEPGDLATVLLLPDGHADLKKLFSLCLKHPLITHRLFRAKSMMLDKPASVKDNVKYTRDNVEWQIKRIYRVRNAIVHTGSAASLLPQLTQHLHCYFVKTMHSILTDLDRQSAWTIRDSLEHRLQLFNHVLNFFGKTPGDQIAIEAIINPEACMLPQSSPFAWPTPPAAEATPAPAVPTAPAPPKANP